MLLALGIVLLLFEVIKGARPGAKFLTDHLLSLIVFGAAAAEFVLWPRFGTSTYFLLALLALVGFPVRHCAARAARHADCAGGLAGGRPRCRWRRPNLSSSRRIKPPPGGAGPPNRRRSNTPKVAPADIASSAPSPVVPSPELQPGNGSPPRRTRRRASQALVRRAARRAPVILLRVEGCSSPK